MSKYSDAVRRFDNSPTNEAAIVALSEMIESHTHDDQPAPQPNDSFEARITALDSLIYHTAMDHEVRTQMQKLLDQIRDAAHAQQDMPPQGEVIFEGEMDYISIHHSDDKPQDWNRQASDVALRGKIVFIPDSE